MAYAIAYHVSDPDGEEGITVVTDEKVHHFDPCIGGVHAAMVVGLRFLGNSAADFAAAFDALSVEIHNSDRDRLSRRIRFDFPSGKLTYN